MAKEWEEKEPTMPRELCYLYGEFMEDYLHDINICQQFAKRNREKMAEILLEKTGLVAIETFQTIHNYIDVAETDSWQFEGFPNQETYQVFLTHPLAGFYYRLDGKLGTYRVWHDRLKPKPAKLVYAKFELLERMRLVSFEDQLKPYSVLIEPINEFTIYLPPTVL